MASDRLKSSEFKSIISYYQVQKHENLVRASLVLHQDLLRFPALLWAITDPSYYKCQNLTWLLCWEHNEMEKEWIPQIPRAVPRATYRRGRGILNGLMVWHVRKYHETQLPRLPLQSYYFYMYSYHFQSFLSLVWEGAKVVREQNRARSEVEVLSTIGILEL